MANGFWFQDSLIQKRQLDVKAKQVDRIMRNTAKSTAGNFLFIYLTLPIAIKMNV